MALSTIEWTESTWNPVTGCSKVSPACKNCYAERIAKRLQRMGYAKYSNGFDVTTHENVLTLPFNWKKPQMIFVNSMSDLFHESVPVEFILKTFEIMNQANWHTYQILTKRVKRLVELNGMLPWSDHIWMGVSVENKDYAFRIDYLRKTTAKVKFVSFEPLLEPIPELNLAGIKWVIVGGESGPGARRMEKTWVTDIRNQCQAKDIPFFFKQWGGSHKKKRNRVLDGRTWDGMPRLNYEVQDMKLQVPLLPPLAGHLGVSIVKPTPKRSAFVK